MLIGITGYKQSGKDTAGEVLVSNHDFIRFAFADRLKEMALAIDPLAVAGSSRRLSDMVDDAGWDYAKSFPEVRRFLQRLGKEGVRDHLGDQVWIDAVFRDADQLIRANANVVITDVRYPNEAEAIRKRGGKIWRIVRIGQPATADSHSSETGVDMIHEDLRIANIYRDDLVAEVPRALERSA